MTTSRFDRAIAALVKGYFTNTLQKANCRACACGNIIAASCNYTYVGSGETLDWLGYDAWTDTTWDDIFKTVEGYQIIHKDCYTSRAKKEIDSTGYSWQELAQMEKAFETGTEIFGLDYYKHTPEEIDQDQLNGLMAVVDVLCQLEGIDNAAPYKEQFTKPVLV